MLVRPSRSYWQDAWQRLKANKRALVSLYLVVGLILFTFAGPLVWRVDPALQDIDQISLAPGADRRALVVEPFAAWNGVTEWAESQGQRGLRVADSPNTQSVRLKWDPVAGAGGYMVYRNIYEPEGRDSL
ncbi:MAG TPA: hypothetical protein DEG76_16580, partial [Pseudohongiella sp.]|nr:hypothetical protein [Pseudohongiella sp.]